MSRSKKSRSDRPRRPTFAIVLLVGFIAAVFAFIGFRQIRSAEERRLRLLAGFSDRVETTLSDLADRFGRVVTQRCAAHLDSYLALIPNLHHLETEPTGVPCSGGEEGAAGEGSAATPAGGDGTGGDGGTEARGEIQLETEGPHVRLVYQREPPARAPGPEEAGAVSDPQATGPSQDPTPPSPDGEESPRVRLADTARVRIDLEALIEPMIIPGIFDSVMVTDAEGEVLHRYGDPELKASSLADLLGKSESVDGKDEDPDSWKIRLAEEGGSAGEYILELLRTGSAREGPPPGSGEVTAILETEVAHSDHAVFLQPITLKLQPVEGQDAPPPVHWIAVGLVSSENLLSAGVTTSPILLFLLVSIVPLGLVIWPFLKLSLISRRQAFTRLDLASLVLAAVLGLSFLALLLLDGLFLLKLRGTVDEQLAELSHVIHRSLRLEVLDAHLQLAVLSEPDELQNLGSLEPFQFEALRESAEESASSGEAASSSVMATERQAEAFIESTVEAYFDQRGSLPQVYPYFDSVFWPSVTGDLIGANLPLRRHAVLPQNVGDRQYFQCAREAAEDPARADLTVLRFDPAVLTRYRRSLEARLRSVEGAVPTALEEAIADLPSKRRKVELCFHSFLDRTTGEAVAAVSIPVEDVRFPSEARADSVERPAAALVTQLTSLHHSVLPPEMGFAVVEPSGRVLFHSDSRRVLTENFLKATDENRLLQSLLESGREGSLPLHYWGRRHRVHVQPVKDLPWTLITFRSMQDIRLRNFELIYDFVNPFLLNLALLALLTALFRWLSRQRFRVYVWPSSRHLAAYRRIVYWTLFVLGAYFVVLAADGWGHGWTFYGSLAVIPATFLFIVVGLPILQRSQRLVGTWRAVLAGSGQAGRTVLPDGLAARLGHELGQTRLFRKARILILRSRVGRGGRSLWQALPSVPALKRWKRRRAWSLAITVLGLTIVSAWALLRGADLVLVFLWLALATTTVAFVWLESEFREGQRRKVAYIFALSCLLLLSVLPTFGFFHLARSRQIQFFTQDAMVSLIDRAEERNGELEARRGPIPDLYPAYDEVLASTRDAYLEGLFDGSLRPPSPGPHSYGHLRARRKWPYGRPAEARDAADGPALRGEPRQPWRRRLGQSLRSVMLATLSARPVPLNDLSSQPLGVDLSRYGTPVEGWRRHLGTDGLDRLVLPLSPSHGPFSGMELAATIPNVGTLTGAPLFACLLLVLGLALLGAGPYLLSRFIAREIVLIGAVYYGRRGGPRESVKEVLEEARSEASSEIVKRMVLVAGQLDREAWKDLTVSEEDLRREAEERSRPGASWIEALGRRGPSAVQRFLRRASSRRQTEVEPAHSGEELSTPRYYEVSFRMAWESVLGEWGGLQSETADPPGAGETGQEEAEVGGGAGEEFHGRVCQFVDALQGSCPEGSPILLTDFDPEIRNPRVASCQIAALQDLIERKGHSVVILSDVVPLRPPDREEPDEARRARSRWLDLLGSFPVRYAQDTRILDSFWTRVGSREKYVESLFEQKDGSQVEHWLQLIRLIGDECEHTPTLRELGWQLLNELSRDMELNRVDERIEELRQEIEELERAPAGEPGVGGDREDPESQRTEKLEKVRSLERRREHLREARDYRTLLTEDHVIARIGAEARLHYRYLWSQCTTDEKLVLVQLARNGLVNPKYFGWVLDLMNRGLVVRGPDLRIMNRSFRRFVDQEVRRSDVLEWEEELGPNAWGVLKWILPFPLLALAGFLFITQRDAVSNVAGVLVALASLTPVVFNLYDKFQQVNLRGSRAGAGGGPDAEDE